MSSREYQLMFFHLEIVNMFAFRYQLSTHTHTPTHTNVVKGCEICVGSLIAKQTLVLLP